MVTTFGLAELLPLARDMTASLSSDDRLRRLVEAVHRALPSDAVALLRLDGEDLVPVAARGLVEDALGRRFPRSAHPRLDVICAGEGPTLFPADSPLPDPYDGLVAGAHGGADADAALLGRSVHACLGCPLRVEGQLVGVLTADAMAAGAFDGVPREFLEHLAALAGAALRTGALIDALERKAARHGRVAQDLVRDALARRGDILVGGSAVVMRLRQEVELVARSSFAVLVTGETGVGKELVVRTLHQQSRRADQPLVYLNCAALPESVAESELFGHTRGAFTGAAEARQGKFKVADGACLFLDEIGELPLHLQPKLLRVLQEGELQPVGSDRTERVDVRIFAATNRDLEAEVRAGRFRADLLHRLDVCRLHVPPLREHLADIPALAGHCADRVRKHLGCGPIRFEPTALCALEAGEWPGNVRELENVVSRALLRASSRVAPGEVVLVREADLDVRRSAGAGAGAPSSRAAAADPPTEAAGPAADAAPRAERSAAVAAQRAERSAAVAALDRGDALQVTLARFEREVLAVAIERARGNWAAAARALGVDRSNLHRAAKRLGLK
ncbi:MAG: nitric oxide reductase transcriptional regulator NorR [Planctomycetota bacterium]